MQMLRREGIAILLAALPCACALAQNAASYPGKPIHVIVPYPAGGVVDGLMRSIGQPVGESVGQTVIVDNRPGANTIIALEACAKAAPDGYTLCASSSDGMSFNPHLYPKLPYDADRDFAPVTQLVWVNGVIVAGARVPYDTVRDMIDHAKRKPGAINFASFGMGSTPHFFVEWFNKVGEVDIVHVPYKGSAQILPSPARGARLICRTSRRSPSRESIRGCRTGSACSRPPARRRRSSIVSTPSS